MIGRGEQGGSSRRTRSRGGFHKPTPGREFVIFQCGNRKLTIAPKTALHREASNMSSQQSRERAHVNEAVGVFSKLEGEIRELVTAAPRSPQGNDNELAASNVSLLLRRVSVTSVQEIENLIAELQILRGKLENEAARVQREIVGYAVLIQNAKQSMRTISESFSFWKNDRDTSRASA
jgi:hypothetical protein